MKHFCVISHTHWDREWYQPFGVFRFRLVDLIDRLLGIIKKYPDYIFHLDAQTVVLEDYLAVRPARRAELARAIKRGNIIVGPWYLQNDFYLSNGEATIRNLVYGIRDAESFGACSRVGYAPDQFGVISQLPQILAGFGIDSIVFGRGYTVLDRNEQGEVYRKSMPCEFLWRGADGSVCTAVHMTWWYNNAQRIPSEPDKANLLLDITGRNAEELSLTPYVLLMNGVDHLEAQDDLIPVLEMLNAESGIRDRDIRQYTLDEYVSTVKRFLTETKTEPSVFDGELLQGSDYDLLRGCYSSRVYLKRANVRCETLLTDVLEPLYAVLRHRGMKDVYPADHFDYLWRKMLKMLPHDNICCCSNDATHRHMEDAYAVLEEEMRDLERRGMELLAHHTSVRKRSEQDYLVTVFNPTEAEFTDVVRVTLTLPKSEHIAGFRIYDENAKAVPYVLKRRYPYMLDVFSPLNLPGVIDCDFVEIEFMSGPVAPLAVKNFRVRASGAEKKPSREMRQGSAIENAVYRVEVRGGKIELTDKRDGRVMTDALYLQDSSDLGDSYVYVPGGEARRYDWRGADVSLAEYNACVKTLRVSTELDLCAGYEFERGQPSEERARLPFTLELTLSGDTDSIGISYRFENTARDHRLRLVFGFGRDTDEWIVDTPFDVRRRKKTDCSPVAMSYGFCNTSFAAVEDASGGSAVLTEGQHDAELIDGDLALTVVRATGVISRSNGKCTGGKVWEAPENQCLRMIEGRMGLVLYRGGYADAGIAVRAKQFRTGLSTFFTGADPHKFKGGRFAVQDAKLAQFYYLEDPYRKVRIANNDADVRLGAPLAMSAYKAADDGKGMILRVWNPAEQDCRTHLEVKGKIYASGLDEKRGCLLGEKRAEFVARAKEIITFYLAF